MLGFGSLAQETEDDIFEKHNTVFIEVGGNGMFYSINYDRILTYGKTMHTTFRCGFTFMPMWEFLDIETILGPIFELNELFGKQDHYFEMGIGISSLAFITSPPWPNGRRPIPEMATYIMPRIGYRLQKRDSKFMFRVGFTPLVFYMWDFDDTALGFVPWGGIGVGNFF